MVCRVIVADLSTAGNSTSMASDLSLGQGISVDMDIGNSSDDDPLSASIHMPSPISSRPYQQPHTNIDQEAARRLKAARMRAKAVYERLKKVISTPVTDATTTNDAGNAISPDIADNDMRLYGAAVVILKSTNDKDLYQRALLIMYHLIARLCALNGRPTTLVPLYHASAGYVTIDSGGLYYLIKNVAAKSSGIVCPGPNVADFAKNRLHHWPRLANIPTKLVLRPGDAVVGNKTYFRYSFATDGVGTSLYTRTWKSRPNAAKNPEPAKQKATRLANAAANHQWTLDDFDRAFLGIDPGRLATLTAKRLGVPDWEYSLSTDSYYKMCGYDDDKKKATKKIDDIDGLRGWMSRAPMAKAASSQETLKYLRYIYRSDYFRQHMELQLDIHTRIDRWETFKRQQRAIVQICRRLTEGLDRKKTTICVGNATFNSSSRGHIAGPSTSRFVDFLHRDGWDVIMLQPGELPYKLCDVGSPADGHAFYHKPSNSHFVKRCTRCRTIWNRDVNAALNIAYLGMMQCYRHQRQLCFRQGLKRPPAYVTRRQITQAAERAAALSTKVIAPVAPVVANDIEAIKAEAVDDAGAGLSNTERRLLAHRRICKASAQARRERKAREAASIAATPKHYIQRLAMTCPAPDPETEWQKAHNKVMKGEEKWVAKKEASKKSKVKVKRTADDSATVPNEPPSRKAKTAPKKTAPKRPTPKKKVPEEPEEPAPKK
ncbi:hypothetical protein IWW37_001105 [Coemansia sp. RSA 2050]|nr:hypothetical protein IWW37_001105 [Coemansia sp. RSA 2050]KAJ2733234.1 hypothetical protein IW152_003233 [Coemansia sp. BCRC 34962]